MKKVRSNKGFTLVELIIVIAILAIIMLIAIPNFSGIQQRMKVRADKATAAQIGKAVRVWYTDYTSDPTLSSSLNIPQFGATTDNTPVLYSTLSGIEGYSAKNYKPSSLTTDGVAENFQGYATILSNTSTTAKVMVGVVKTDKNPTQADAAITTNFATGTEVNYNGTTAAIAYIEP